MAVATDEIVILPLAEQQVVARAAADVVVAVLAADDVVALLAVDRLLDMSRTAVNVFGDSCAADRGCPSPTECSTVRM